jgi:hypothetical protein
MCVTVRYNDHMTHYSLQFKTFDFLAKIIRLQKKKERMSGTTTENESRKIIF